jgi:hypothetical protein
MPKPAKHFKEKGNETENSTETCAAAKAADCSLRLLSYTGVFLIFFKN